MIKKNTLIIILSLCLFAFGLIIIMDYDKVKKENLQVNRPDNKFNSNINSNIDSNIDSVDSNIDNTNNDNNIDSNVDTNIDNSIKQNNDNEVDEGNTVEDSTYHEDKENTDIDINDNVSEDNIDVLEDEIALISYFSLEEQELDTLDKDNPSIRQRAKDIFVNIVDFIFYDKEIKGYTFKGLTTKAKLKIINIALSIDSKIDKYFPDYKDIIKDKYNDIKGALALKYLEFTSYICDSVGSSVCEEAKKDFNNMKKSFNFTFDLIKELAKSGSNKLKEFYENFRD